VCLRSAGISCCDRWSNTWLIEIDLFGDNKSSKAHEAHVEDRLFYQIVLIDIHGRHYFRLYQSHWKILYQIVWYIMSTLTRTSFRVTSDIFLNPRWTLEKRDMMTCGILRCLPIIVWYHNKVLLSIKKNLTNCRRDETNNQLSSPWNCYVLPSWALV
jgi:hypothetical protein